jgi:hypothetical protein
MKSAAPNGAFIFSAIRTARPQGARRFYFGVESFSSAVKRLPVGGYSFS